MDYHQNARLTIPSREQMCRKVLEQGLTLKRAAARFSVSPRTAKWVGRYRIEGVAGLLDRSSRPRCLRSPTPQEKVLLVESMRRQRWTGQRIAFSAMYPNEGVDSVLSFLGVLHPAWHPDARPADRQRRSLLLEPLRPDLPAARDQTSPHPALHSTNQWKSRTLHPDSTARVGLCSLLPKLSRKGKTPQTMDPPVQLA